MNSRICPACATPMRARIEPDIVTDICPGCGGTFFDKGELNSFATGMAGNIEYNSIDDDDNRHADRFGYRNCPKCDGEPMRKINLLGLSDIIFDFCPGCEGMFLDKNEIGSMNAYLRSLSGAEGPEEFREFRDGRLIRIDKLLGVTSVPLLSISNRPVDTFHVRITVYLQQPLEAGLRIFGETWTAKLAKIFGLFEGPDILSGYDDLDRAFIIQGEDECRIQSILKSDEVREALSMFADGAPRIFSERGRLEVLDYCVVYTEGPYSGVLTANLKEVSSAVIDRLFALASALDSSDKIMPG